MTVEGSELLSQASVAILDEDHDQTSYDSETRYNIVRNLSSKQLTAMAKLLNQYSGVFASNRISWDLTRILLRRKKLDVVSCVIYCIIID